MNYTNVLMSLNVATDRTIGHIWGQWRAGTQGQFVTFGFIIKGRLKTITIRSGLYDWWCWKLGFSSFLTVYLNIIWKKKWIFPKNGAERANIGQIMWIKNHHIFLEANTNWLVSKCRWISTPSLSWLDIKWSCYGRFSIA